FEGANVAPFAADDAPLHVVAGNVNGADGGVRGMPRRDSLNSRDDDFARLLVAGRANALLVLVDSVRKFVAEFALDALEQNGFRLIAGHAADFVQLHRLLFEQGRDFGLAFFEGFAAFNVFLVCMLGGALLLRKVALQLFNSVFALFQAAFLLANLAACLFHFAAEFGPLLEQLVLGAQVGFLIEIVRFLACLGQDFLALLEQVIVVGFVGGCRGAVPHKGDTDPDQRPRQNGAADPDPGDFVRTHRGHSRLLFRRPGGLLGGQANLRDRTGAKTRWIGTTKRHTNR